MPKQEVNCGSCGAPAIVNTTDQEGWYCPNCIKYWTRDPLTKNEKQKLTEPLHIAQIRKIVTDKSAAGVKCPITKRRLMVDLFSASAIIQVYDAISEESKTKFAGLSLLKAQSICFKLAK